MATNIARNQSAPVHFTLLSDNVIPKNIENKLEISETSKCDDTVEDDVFANENDTNISKDQQTTCLTDIARGNDQNAINTTLANTVITPPDVSAVVSSPTSIIPATTSTTTRRPSYTSKAPSALTNLPKTIDEINNSPSNSLQSFGLNTAASSGFENDGIRSSAKELLSLHGQASFESLDEYSNPGTPTIIGIAHSPSTLHGAQSSRQRERAKLRTEVISRGRWESAVQAQVLTVKCRDKIGELHKSKFGSGSKGKCIKVRKA